MMSADSLATSTAVPTGIPTSAALNSGASHATAQIPDDMSVRTNGSDDPLVLNWVHAAEKVGILDDDD
jgi:hypothetical protein